MMKKIIVLSFLLFNIGIITFSFYYATMIGVGVFDTNYSIFAKETTKLSQEEVKAIFWSIENFVILLPWFQVIAALLNFAMMLVLLVRQDRM